MKELTFKVSEKFYNGLGDSQKGLLNEKIQYLLDGLAGNDVVARGGCNCNDCSPCSCDVKPCKCFSTSFCRCDRTVPTCSCDDCIPTPCGCDKKK